VSTWKTLTGWGFTPEERPEDTVPDIPEDITELTDQQLMQLMGAYTAWTVYAADRKAASLRDLRNAEKHLRYVTALASVRATSERTVAGRKAAAQADPEVQQVETEVADAVDLAEAMDVVWENTKIKIQLASRELSRRIAQHGHEQRAAKWGV
jgi:Zn-dependent oligopeptidase